MTKSRSSHVFSLAFLLIAGVVQVSAAPSASPVKTKTGAEVTKTKSGLVSSTPSTATPSYNAKALHRLDFRVKGKSCAVCLLNIQKHVGTVPGAIKAAVQLQPPYAAVVLFDSSKTNSKTLLNVAKEGYPEVSFEAIEDKPIDKLPLVLVPKVGGETLTN
ncbi:MAG TPA: hypothetical protein V6C76_08190 [Drouetiella sp.]